MSRIKTLALFLLCCNFCLAQSNTFTGKEVRQSGNSLLDKQFYDYDLYELDLAAIDAFVNQEESDFILNLHLGDDYRWKLPLYPHDMRGPGYQVVVQTEKGQKVMPARKNMTYRGYLSAQGGGVAGFTINDHHFAGTVKLNEEIYFVEPVHYFDETAPRNQVVVYAESMVKPHEGVTCGADELNQKRLHLDPGDLEEIGAQRVDDCWEVELAIASDWLMYLDYNQNVTEVEDHNITVMNNVATNWDDEFADEIQFVIVTQFVSDCNTCDPWSPSTNAGTLLSSFRSWGNSGGFGVPFDLGQLWTDRDFNGGTIGIAYISGLCTSNKYHCLQDWTTNQNLLRVLVSHEIGHNFSATHDAAGSPTIMAPAVNNTNTWSAQSISQIENLITTRLNQGGCFSACAGQDPPVVDFSADVTSGCAPLTVNFTDLSVGAVTSWDWSFPGGTPATSTLQNPVVTYNNPGTFDVTLTATNDNGSSTLTKVAYISTFDGPQTSFFSNVVNDEAFFTNTTVNGLSWSWDFGDGQFSNEFSPSHIYEEDGTYTVTLSATNACGTTTFSETITILTLPTANFTSNVQEGCEPLVVNFINLSSNNAEFFLWTMPGASPEVSTDENPVVVYTESGTYDVTLEVINGAGSNSITQTNYITVEPLPTAGFDFNVNGNVVDFTNVSTDANSYSWDFGDGNDSEEENPSHTYDEDGTYTVTLVATNDCGDDIITQEVTIVTAPVAGIDADVFEGCASLTVNFIDASTNNVETWAWEFPGGNPSSSDEQNPTVVYETEGIYDVTLTVTNQAGESTVTEVGLIFVNDVPTPGFTYEVSGTTVDFSNTSVGADSYNWDFGDGNTSTEENPSHTYDDDGEYTVTLTATNDCGDVTITETVEIITAPTSGFIADVTSGCVELTVQFTDESSPNVDSWAWTFEGGNPSSSTEQNPTVVYETAGSYDVTLTVTNAAGQSTTTEVAYVVVEDVPEAGFSSTTTNETQVNFTNTSTNANAYSWDFGDGNTSMEENPMHDYDGDGTYTVELIATNDCGNDTTTQTITIVTSPVSGFTADVTSGCVELTVQFSDESTPNVDSWAWTFDGGNPSSSTEQNPTVVYETAGTYDVTLTVTNAAGQSTTTEFAYVVVDEGPEAGFSSNITNNTNVDFTNTSNNATSYSWDFGDGNSSTEENPMHEYDTDGVYTVELIATNACGSDTTTQEITIVTPPTAGFSANTTSGCASLTVEFSDESSPNTTGWEWDFPGGNPSSSTEQNPTVTYDAAGTYDVTLTVTNAAGESTTTEVGFVVVTTVPDAGFNSMVNGASVDFTNTSTNATSYSWDFGDGNSSTEENPTNLYDEDGEYTVELTATNDCGSVTTTQVINIGTLPTAGFSVIEASGCGPLTVEFTDESSPNTTSWNWTFEGGTPATSTEQNPVVIFDLPGSYTVTLEAINDEGSNTLTEVDYIVVEDIPEAGFNSNTTNNTVVDFTNTSTNAGSYSWDFGDGNSSTEENPQHDFETDGVYTVVLTAINNCGTETFTEIITIVTPPSAGFSAENTSGCPDLTVQFNDESSPNTTSWSWQFPGGTPATSTEQNPSVIYDTPGTYDVTLTVTNTAGESTIEETSFVVVDDVPEAGFTVATAGATANFTNTSTNANSYSWDFGDGNSSTEENPSHEYDTDGDYTVVLTATNDCGSTTYTETVTAVTPPVAAFSADITSGCEDLSVQFTDESSTNATGWNWTFEGGTPATSTEQHPLVVFEDAGAYTVTLEVTNAAGSNTVTITEYIVVNTTPSAGFSGAVVNTVVNFTNESTNATSYHWDFGDGNESMDTNPSHDFETDGMYTVTLTATNECGSVTTTETFEIVTEPLAGFSADITTGCASLTVNFIDESSGNTTSWEWSFPGGNPSSSTEQNPTVVYDTPGSYNVTLIATSGAGSNTYTQTQFIVVNTVPTVDFNSNVNGATVNFLNNSTGATSYLWEFGDGNTSTLPNPEHTYEMDGNYTVTLTATNECGSVTTTNVVAVVAPPVAAFSADVTLGCGPLTVQFEDESLNAASWLWTFSGGTPNSSTEENPLIVYNTPGVYSVTLQVTNTAGTDVTTFMQYIVVEAFPQASFTSNITGSIGIFTNTGTGGTSFEWDFGDGSPVSTEENPTHFYDEDGEYEVTLTVSNSCGTASTTETITIVTPPTAMFSADDTEGCAPFTVQFTNESSNNAENWSWSFPGGTPSTSTEQNPVVVYDAAGTYDVSLMVSNTAGMSTALELGYIVVGDVPAAGFTSITTGATVNFTNTTTNGTTYEWMFGDGETSTQADPEHQYPGAGDWEVTLIATNECGSSTFTQTITIEGVAPTPSFSADLQNGCVPMTVNFTDETTGEPTAWSWTFAGGTPATSNEQNPTVTYDTPGTYEVSLTASNDFGENTVTETSFITVGDVPEAAFNYNDVNGEVTFENTSTGGDSYEWDFGDGSPVSSEENPIHLYDETGDYTVTLTVTNDCGSKTIEMIIQVIITSLQELDNITAFNVFPNPNDGTFTLILEGQGLNDLTMNLYNVLGQSMYAELLDFGSGRLAKTYSFDRLAAGTYIVQLTSGQKVLYKKIVIER